MPATLTAQNVEDKVRKNLINDTAVSAYRWETYVLLPFIADSVDELVRVLNPWAGYNQDTGELLTSFDLPLCRALTSASDETAIANARAEVIAVDNRFEQALVYLVGFKCLSIDDSDIANAEKASQMYEMAVRYAQS